MSYCPYCLEDVEHDPNMKLTEPEHTVQYSRDGKEWAVANFCDRHLQELKLYAQVTTLQ